MKIGFIAHVPFPGTVGGSIRSMELAKALASIGEEIHLYGQLEENLPEIENIYYHDYPTTTWQIPGAIKTFVREFKKYDVIYERFQYLFNNLGFFCSKILGKPYFVEVHGFPVNELCIMNEERERHATLDTLNSFSMLTARIIPDAILKRMEDFIIKNSLRVVVTSEGTRDILLKHGVNSGKIKVIPNAVNTTLFDPHTKAEALRQSDDETIVTFVGTLFNEGVDVILKAAEILKNEKVIFLMVGPGPVEHYKSIIVEKGLKNVDFYGPVSHSKIPSIISGSDILLALYSPSGKRFEEGFHYSPIKIFEYLSMEKPIIAVDVELLRSYFHEHATFVKPDDSQELAEKIMYVKDSEKAKQMANNGRELVLREHTWEKRAIVLSKYLSEPFER